MGYIIFVIASTEMDATILSIKKIRKLVENAEAREKVPNTAAHNAYGHTLPYTSPR